MGKMGWLWFNDEDQDIIKAIASLHKVSEDKVEFYYTKMIEEMKNEVKNENKD